MTKQNLSITELSRAYASGELNPRSLILSLREQALAESDYNVWIHLLSEQELEPFLTNLEKKDAKSLPLYGVPFAIKDNIDLKNIPTTAACPDFSYTPDKSATVVELLISAGAIPLGKTNMDQFATGLVGTRSPYGQGKNAFNPDYASGGSSSGSAIATSLAQVSFALGTDTAGSGRVPAAFNNLIGHKPTKGVFSSTGLVPACRTLDCISVFALTAHDAAIIFDIAAQYDASDAYCRPNHYANKSRYFSGEAPAEFIFGVPEKLDFQGNSECEAMFNKAVAALESIGGKALAFNFDNFSKAAKLLYEGPWVAERWLATKDVKLESMLPVIQTIIGGGNKAGATDAFAAQYKLADFKRLCDEQMAQFDFVLTPTTPTIYTRAEIDEKPIERNSILGTYTNFMNLLDYTATAVPVGQTSAKVYWGVTLFSNAFSDINLLNIASAMQNIFALPLGTTDHAFTHTSQGVQAAQGAAAQGIAAPKDTIDVAVCGAHLEGQPLNWQLSERGATLKQSVKSSAHYKLWALSDGKRPGMQRVKTGGDHIEMEIWTMPSENFGTFVTGIPAPLGIGKVELENGAWVSGFICDAYGLQGAKDVTEYKGWRAWLANA